jgi:hypothetical protein
MSQGTARNVVVFVLAVAVSAAAGWLAATHMPATDLRASLQDLWPVQTVVSTAIAAFIYRLISDTALLKGLSSKQRRTLDSVVSLKLKRLWWLFGLVVLGGILCRVPAKLVVHVDAAAYYGVTGATVLLSVLLALWVPSMWNELRRFLSDALDLQEDEERRAKLLEGLNVDEKPEAGAK